MRRAQFKKGVDHQEARRSRSETNIQIRKANKDEMLSKRRQVCRTSSLPLKVEWKFNYFFCHR